jgi:hypothetical protein
VSTTAASELQHAREQHDAGMFREMRADAKRQDELRAELIAHWRFMAKHVAADLRISQADKLEVFLHSICASLDGVSGQFEHAVDLIIDGLVINDGVMLHEELAR